MTRKKIVPLHPRVQVERTWDSRWFAEGADYGRMLLEDLKIRKHLLESLREAAISKVVIERPAKQCRVWVYAARPAAIIASDAAGIERIQEEVNTLTDAEVSVRIVHVAKPETDAKLIAQGLADQLERRIGWRRALKRAVQSAMRSGAEGIRIDCGGRLGGAEAPRSEWYREGRLPLHTLRANVDHAEALAHTAHGVCGVKVWIFKGEILGYDPMDSARGAGAIEADTGIAEPEDDEDVFSIEGIRAAFLGTIDPRSAEGAGQSRPERAVRPAPAALEEDPISIDRVLRLFKGMI